MKQTELQLTQEQLKKIYGKEWKFLNKKILTNCYCGNCKGQYNATIVDYDIFLTDINDIILKGKCKTCQKPMNRYLETGEVAEFSMAIEKLKKLN